MNNVCIDSRLSSCVELVPLWQWEDDSAAVAMLFAAEDCETGEASPGYEASAFAIEEDGKALPSEAVSKVLSSKGLRVYVTLLLDMSGSRLQDLGELAKLQAGARRFVDEILVTQGLTNVYISLQAFDGSPKLMMLENPSRDVDKLNASIDALIDFEGGDLSSRNLYGATLQGVENLQEHQQRVMDLNYGGVVTSGYLVLFTTGDDLSGHVEDIKDVSEVVSSARVFDASADAQPTPTVRTIAVSLNDNDYDPKNLIDLVGGEEWVTETNSAGLETTLVSVGQQIGHRIKSTYLLAYCSTLRAGDHNVTLKMAANESNQLSFEFNAEEFDGSCSDQFFEAICKSRSCGGFNCGACEDESEVCDEANGSCINACVEQDQCEGEQLTNDLGYTQTCGGEGIGRCLEMCMDMSANDEHCGSCGNACSGDSTCSDGVCVCPENKQFCDGGCQAPGYFEDSAISCGTCGNSCAILCMDSECLEPIQISGGGSHTCALLSDGTVRCWGSNGSGELGDGSTINRSAPVVVSELSGVTQISGGGSHTCALLENGTVRCWGNNDFGQLGDGGKENNFVPVDVTDLADVTQISGGGSHTCALLAGGTVYCWGDNFRGQLGNGGKEESLKPVAVTELTGVTQISGGDNHTCAVRSDGTVRCWGWNYFGQLGDGDGGEENSFVPVNVTDLTDATQISAGSTHTCAVLKNGTVRCWGYGQGGELGDGEKSDSTAPVAVTGLKDATRIAVGGSHTCALRSGRTMSCWGSNGSGQLGVGGEDSPTPVEVTELKDAIRITAGNSHTCVLRSDGMVSCWGYNMYGQLGDGSKIDRNKPTSVVW